MAAPSESPDVPEDQVLTPPERENRSGPGDDRATDADSSPEIDSNTIEAKLIKFLGALEPTLVEPEDSALTIGEVVADGPPSTLLDSIAGIGGSTEIEPAPGSPGTEFWIQSPAGGSSEGPSREKRFVYQGCVTPGTIIDDYEVLGLIGWGGMGEVYRARHRMTAFDQEVAVKIIRRSIWDAETRASDPTRLVERFYVEMRAASLIRDDHVVPVLNAGLFDGFPYYVMLFVDGASLSVRLKGGRMKPVEAASLLGPIARAVDQAHAKGVVHRDIKPSNIIIDAAGKPYLTDFGLAKMFEQSRAMTLTAKDVLMGTPQYISPEQVRNASGVDARSDVYSLGATLYEMLTGRPPFTGDDSMAVVIRVLNEPVTPPQRINPDVPDELNRICVRCLEKDPSRRFRSAAELAEELARFTSGVPIETQDPSFFEVATDWVRQRPVISGLVLAVVASVLIGLISTTIQLFRARAALNRLEYKAYLGSIALASAALDSGQAQAAENYLRDCPESYRDWEWRFLERLRHRKQLTPLRRFPGTIYSVAFRPGARSIVAAGRLDSPWLWDVAEGRKSGELPGLPAAVSIYDVAWTTADDGRDRIVGTCSDGRIRVWTRADDGWSACRELIGHKPGAAALAVSRDGRTLVSGGDDGRLLVWNLDDASDTTPNVLIGDGPAILGLAFTPDGRLVSVGEKQPPRVWSPTTGERVELAGWPNDDEARLAVAVSPSGRFTAVAGADGSLVVWDRSTPEAPPRVLEGHFVAVNSVVFSPDERRLAAADSDGLVTFWDCSNWENVLARKGNRDDVEALAFSDDGLILASAGADGSVVFWDASPWSGPALPAPVKLDGGAGAVGAVSIRPDGEEIAAGCSNGVIQLWDVPTGTLKRTLPGHERRVNALAYSRDGRKLASVGREGAVKLWDLTPGDDGEIPDARVIGKHAGRCIALAYRDDGRLLVTGGADRMLRFWDLTGDSPSQARLAPDEVYCLAFSPDGESLASAGADEDAAITIWRRGPGGWSHAKRLLGHVRQVNGLAFDRQGRLASVSHDWTGRVWDGDDDEPTILRGHVSRLWGVAVSREGTRIATAGGDRSVRVWDVATGEEGATLLAHTGRVRAVAFDPANRFLASSGDDGAVYLWDASRWGGAGTESTADRSARMKAGEVPQQPPTNAAPASTSAGRNDAKASGVIP